VDVRGFHVPSRDGREDACFACCCGGLEDPVCACSAEVEVEVEEVACVWVVGGVGAGEGALPLIVSLPSPLV
jgi:hypothetical protein